MHEHNIGCEVDADDHQRNAQRRDDILECVEHPDQEGRRRLARQSEAEEGQRVRGLPHGIGSELPALEERGRDRHAEQRQADRRGHQHEDVEP